MASSPQQPSSATPFLSTSRRRKHVRNGEIGRTSQILGSFQPSVKCSERSGSSPEPANRRAALEARQSGETATEELIRRNFCLIGGVTMLPVTQTRRRERLCTPLRRLDRGGEAGTHLRRVFPRPRCQPFCRILKRAQCCDERKLKELSFFLSFN